MYIVGYIVFNNIVHGMNWLTGIGYLFYWRFINIVIFTNSFTSMLLLTKLLDSGVFRCNWYYWLFGCCYEVWNISTFSQIE